MIGGQEGLEGQVRVLFARIFGEAKARPDAVAVENYGEDETLSEAPISVVPFAQGDMGEGPRLSMHLMDDGIIPDRDFLRPVDGFDGGDCIRARPRLRKSIPTTV